MIPRGIIGVVHLHAMPGDPGAAEGFEDVIAHALEDARRWKEAGASALIVENFGSAPFPKGTRGHRLPPHQVAAMTRAVERVQGVGLPVGVNCLRNDARSALGIAAACDAAFIRINVHTGAYVTDQGLIEGEADETLRYRASLGASEVAILADVLVKHASPLAPLTMTRAVEETLKRGRADAVIVSGTGTGAPVDAEVLAEARAAAGDAVVLLGSGLTPQNASALAKLADGAFVGTYAKVDGVVNDAVDVERARAVVSAFSSCGRLYAPET